MQILKLFLENPLHNPIMKKHFRQQYQTEKTITCYHQTLPQIRHIECVNIKYFITYRFFYYLSVVNIHFVHFVSQRRELLFTFSAAAHIHNPYGINSKCFFLFLLKFQMLHHRVILGFLSIIYCSFLNTVYSKLEGPKV